MSEPYFFYRESCPLSKQIIESLKGVNRIFLYKFISMDSLHPNQIPKYVTSIPTLYDPTTKEVFVREDIYRFIAKYKPSD
jgi:hypothetical protein